MILSWCQGTRLLPVSYTGLRINSARKSTRSTRSSQFLVWSQSFVPSCRSTVANFAAKLERSPDEHNAVSGRTDATLAGQDHPGTHRPPVSHTNGRKDGPAHGRKEPKNGRPKPEKKEHKTESKHESKKEPKKESKRETKKDPKKENKKEAAKESKEAKKYGKVDGKKEAKGKVGAKKGPPPTAEHTELPQPHNAQSNPPEDKPTTGPNPNLQPSAHTGPEVPKIPEVPKVPEVPKPPVSALPEVKVQVDEPLKPGESQESQPLAPVPPVPPVPLEPSLAEDAKRAAAEEDKGEGGAASQLLKQGLLMAYR